MGGLLDCIRGLVGIADLKKKEHNVEDQTPQVAPASYVTVKLAAVITGLTAKAIYNKIAEGKWLEGREFRRSPDGGVFISMKGYQKWVESAPLQKR
jgi:hypothetical protein